MFGNRFWNFNRENIKIKICDIKTLEVAYEAYKLGVDALGFHMWSRDSQEEIENKLSLYKWITSYLPNDISCFLLTDLQDHSKILSIFRKIPRFDTLQLQGNVSLKIIEQIGKKLKEKLPELHFVKTLGIKDTNPQLIKSLSPYVDAILLDSKPLGGTGETHDWPKSAQIVKIIDKPIILAGGLEASNVKEAINTVRPYAVDAESRLEYSLENSKYGKVKIKSMVKIIDFIGAVRGNLNTQKAKIFNRT